MAEYGEWNKKGATLSDKTAMSEYKVDREFIIKGIESGKLEYRSAANWGYPYARILRSQLEKYIAGELGGEYLERVKNESELLKIKKKISYVEKILDALQARRTELEKSLNK